jgi:hypothetical protein
MIFGNYHYSISDFIGNCGVILLMGTFLFVQLGKIKVESILYNVVNGIVAILLLINLYFKPNLSGIVIEVWWLMLSVYGFVKVKKKREVKAQLLV